jgi:hypothetical protein
MGEAWSMSAKKPVPSWVYFIPFMIAGLVVVALAYDLVMMGLLTASPHHQTRSS